MSSPIRTLFVMYDARCGLCSAIRDWLLEQPKLVGLALLPAGSDAAVRMLRGIPPPSPDELVVVSDTGAVWRGNHAWVVVLWALRNYRGWARRLSSPALLPAARRIFATLSGSRAMISSCLGLEPKP
jgi:predicted DCC family thiol-disulfide oxidoreductase YuxK